MCIYPTLKLSKRYRLVMVSNCLGKNLSAWYRATIKTVFLLPIFLFFYLIHTPSVACAQVTVDQLRHTIRVKLLDDFIARFNNYNTPQNSFRMILDSMHVSSEAERRKTSIKFLFRRDQKWDSLVVSSFIDSVISNRGSGIFLNLSDTNWYADVNCDFQLDGQSKQVRLIMRTFTDSLGGMKWYISGIESTIFDQLNGKAGGAFIAPIAHELDFLALQKVFDDKNNIISYLGEEYSADKLSVFVFLLKTGRLKFKKVLDNQFIFCQIPGWKFTVRDFKEDSYNAGLLIYELSIR